MRSRTEPRARRHHPGRSISTVSASRCIVDQPISDRADRLQAVRGRTADRSSIAGSRRTPRRCCSSPSKSNPHTSLSSSGFVAVAAVVGGPAPRAARAHGRVSTISLGPRQHRRLAGSTRRSPMASTPSGAPVARRIKRPQPGDEHHEAEGLAEEVVGAELEALGLVVLALLGREQQDRRVDATRPQLAAHGEAVEPRQQHVEHDGRVAAFVRAPQPVGAGVGDVDVEALGAQATGDRRREPGLVLDEEQAHGRSLPKQRALRRRALSSSSGVLTFLSAADRHRAGRMTTPAAHRLSASILRAAVLGLIAACGGGGGDGGTAERGQPRHGDDRRRPIRKPTATTTEPSTPTRRSWRTPSACVSRASTCPTHSRPAPAAMAWRASAEVDPSSEEFEAAQAACEPIMEDAIGEHRDRPRARGGDARADAGVRRVHARARHRHARPGVR